MSPEFGRRLSVLALWSASACSALEMNSASRAELEAVPGIGVAAATAIVDERAKRPFGDWSDFVARVKGIGHASAARLSERGLRIDGRAYSAPATAPAQRTPRASAQDRVGASGAAGRP